MKKFLLIPMLLASLLAPAQEEYQWNSEANLALGSAMAASSARDSGDVLANATDGNANNRWQAKERYNTHGNDWIILNLKQSQQFTDIAIKWEASHPTAYDIYVSENEIPYLEETVNRGTDENPDNITFNVIDKGWLLSATPIISGGENNNDTYTESLLLKEAVKAQYVLIYCTEYNDNAKNYGSSIFEVWIANIERNKITSLYIPDINVNVGEKITVDVKALNDAGDEMDKSLVKNMQLVASNPAAVNIVDKGNGTYEIEGIKIGEYTLTATADVEDGQVNGQSTLFVDYNWTSVENIAKDKDIVSYRWNSEAADTENVGSLAVDGDNTTYYQFNGNWEGGEAWVLVDLGAEYSINALGADFGKYAGTMNFAYSTNNTLTECRNSKFEDINEFAEWTKTGAVARRVNGITTYVLENPITARYIVVNDLSNPQKPCLYEIYIDGLIKDAEAIATSIELSSAQTGRLVGESFEIDWLVKDQYGALIDVEDKPIFEVLDGNASIENGKIIPSQKGTLKIQATILEEIKKEIEFDVVADVENYINCSDAKVFLDGVEFENSSFIFDGGNDPVNSNGWGSLINHGDPADEQHDILIDLGKAYDLDMFIILWNGAFPGDYEVYMGSNLENLPLTYTVNGITNVKLDNRLYGNDMNVVRYIKIHTLNNATVYGLEFRDIKAYGKESEAQFELSVEANPTVASVGEDITVSVTLSKDEEALPTDDVKVYVKGPGIETEETITTNFTPREAGEYTVVAEYNGFTAEAIVEVVETKVESTHGPHTATSDNSETTEDFDFNTEYTGADAKRFSNVYSIDLDYPHDVQLLKLNWTKAPQNYKVEFVHWEWSRVSVAYPVETRVNSGEYIVDRIFKSNWVDYNDNEETTLYQIRGIRIIVTAEEGLRVAPLDENDYELNGIESYGQESVEADLSGIEDVAAEDATDGLVDVVNLQGVILRRGVSRSEAINGLPAGLYIVGGEKTIVR